MCAVLLQRSRQHSKQWLPLTWHQGCRCVEDCVYSLFKLYFPSVHMYSFAQEKEGAEGLRLRRHDPPEGRKPPSHASAFRNHSNTHTQSRTLQDAPNRKQL